MKGLDNLGNTCYFNCSLQCLLQVPQLSNYMILRNYAGDNEFAKEYQGMVRKVWLKGSGSVNPDKLLELFRLRYPQFRTDNQHDSQEAFLCLLDILDNSLRPFNGNPNHSLIREIFYGKMVQETVCKSGKSIRTEHTPMTILFSKNGETIEQSIQSYQNWTTIENFKDDEGIIHHVSVTRNLFWELPKVLGFTTRMYGEKVRIKISEFLEMKPFLSTGAPLQSDTRYELFAVCKHHGSAHGGHYIAYTKHKGKWYIKNDGFCMETILPKEDYFYFFLFKRVNSSH